MLYGRGSASPIFKWYAALSLIGRFQSGPETGDWARLQRSSGFARHFLSFSESVGDLVISTRLIATSEATSSRPLKGTGFSPYIRDSRLATELSSRLSRPAVEPKRSGEPALSEVEWGPAVHFPLNQDPGKIDGRPSMGEALRSLLLNKATNPLTVISIPSLANKNNCELGRQQLQKQQSAVFEGYGLQPVHN
jgi:hypothetical protein